MECRVLGPLVVRSGSVTGQLTAPKPRKALALLLMHANRIVPVDSLSTELWDDEPPHSAQTTLQTYILQIRRILSRTLGRSPAEVAHDVLVTGSDGYQLQIGAGQLDLHEYERLAAEGRIAIVRGDYLRASQLMRQALDVWQGSALVDVRLGPVLRVEACRLEESRLATWQQLIEIDLRLARHHEILGELSSLAARHPLHEDLQAQYMVALYRAGRRPDALEAFHRLRGVLLHDLGLEPSQRMRRLQHAILTGDPALDGEASPTDQLVGGGRAATP